MSLGEEAHLNRTIVPNGWEPIPSGGKQAAMVLDCYATVVPTPGIPGDWKWAVFDGANRIAVSGYSPTELAAKLAAVEAVREMARATR